jgi:hypothetical protein
VDVSIAIFQHFRPALVQQRQGAPDMTDVQRFVILVQDKDGMVKHCGTSLSSRISFILLENQASVQIPSVLKRKQLEIFLILKEGIRENSKYRREAARENLKNSGAVAGRNCTRVNRHNDHFSFPYFNIPYFMC